MPMANGGGGSSDYESFEEEEEEEAATADPEPKHAPAPKAPAVARVMKGMVAVKAAAKPAAATSRGPTRSKPLAPEASSDSVSPAPARRERLPRSDVPEPPPLPPPARSAEGMRDKRLRGRGKRNQTQFCNICWTEVGAFASALEQHQRWNLDCLQWQHYQEGNCTWDEAKDKAVRTKMRRDARAIEKQARPNEHSASAGGKHVERVDRRDRSAAMGKKPGEVRVQVRVHVREKKKKRKSRRSKRHAETSPTPEVDRRRRRREQPPSSSEEEPPAAKRSRKRQLVITLPDHVRW